MEGGIRRLWLRKKNVSGADQQVRSRNATSSNAVAAQAQSTANANQDARLSTSSRDVQSQDNRSRSKSSYRIQPMLVGISRPDINRDRADFNRDRDRPGTAGSLQKAVSKAADSVTHHPSDTQARNVKSGQPITLSPPKNPSIRHVDIFSIASSTPVYRSRYNEEIAERNLDTYRLVLESTPYVYDPSSKYQEEVAIRNAYLPYRSRPSTETPHRSIDHERTASLTTQSIRSAVAARPNGMHSHQQSFDSAEHDQTVAQDQTGYHSRQLSQQSRDGTQLPSVSPYYAGHGLVGNRGVEDNVQVSYSPPHVARRVQQSPTAQRDDRMHTISESLPYETETSAVAPSVNPRDSGHSASSHLFSDYKVSASEYGHRPVNLRSGSSDRPLEIRTTSDSALVPAFPQTTASSIRKQIVLPNRTIMDLTHEDHEFLSEASSPHISNYSPVIEQAKSDAFHRVVPSEIHTEERGGSKKYVQFDSIVLTPTTTNGVRTLEMLVPRQNIASPSTDTNQTRTLEMLVPRHNLTQPAPDATDSRTLETLAPRHHATPATANTREIRTLQTLVSRHVDAPTPVNAEEIRTPEKVAPRHDTVSETTKTDELRTPESYQLRNNVHPATRPTNEVGTNVAPGPRHDTVPAKLNAARFSDNPPLSNTFSPINTVASWSPRSSVAFTKPVEPLLTTARLQAALVTAKAIAGDPPEPISAKSGIDTHTIKDRVATYEGTDEHKTPITPATNREKITAVQSKAMPNSHQPLQVATQPSQDKTVKAPTANATENKPHTPKIYASPRSITSIDYINPSSAFGVKTRDFALSPRENKPVEKKAPTPIASEKVRASSSASKSIPKSALRPKSTKPRTKPSTPATPVPEDIGFDEEAFKRKQADARAALERLQRSLSEDYITLPDRATFKSAKGKQPEVDGRQSAPALILPQESRVSVPSPQRTELEKAPPSSFRTSRGESSVPALSSNSRSLSAGKSSSRRAPVPSQLKNVEPANSPIDRTIIPPSLLPAIHLNANPPKSPGEISLSSFPVPSSSRPPSQDEIPPGFHHNSYPTAGAMKRRNSAKSQTSTASAFSIPYHMVPGRSSSVRDPVPEEGDILWA